MKKILFSLIVMSSCSLSQNVMAHGGHSEVSLFLHSFIHGTNGIFVGIIFVGFYFLYKKIVN